MCRYMSLQIKWKNECVGVHSSDFYEHEQTVFFWAPTFKWGISLANIADINRPVENISVPQQVGKSSMWSKLVISAYFRLKTFNTRVASLTHCRLCEILWNAYSSLAITATGLIWSKYSLDIIPVRQDLLSSMYLIEIWVVPGFFTNYWDVNITGELQLNDCK